MYDTTELSKSYKRLMNTFFCLFVSLTFFSLTLAYNFIYVRTQGYH